MSDTVPSRIRRSRRRGAVALLLVVVLALLNLLVIAGAVGGRDDAGVAVLRVETARAFYAAESAARILLDQAGSTGIWPTTGTELAVGDAARAVVVQGVDGPDSVLIIEGRSGSAARRIEISLE